MKIKKWLPHIIMILLIGIGLMAQITIRKVDTNFVLYNTSLETVHSTIAQYDSASVVFKKTGGGQWEIYLYDKDGNLDFKVDSLGGVTLGDTLRPAYFKMSTGASNNYVLTSDAYGVGTWQAAGLVLDAFPASDHTANGMTMADTVGENVSFGEVLYCDSTNGRYYKADADTSIKALRGIAMALASISAGNAGNMIHIGYVRDDTWNWTEGKFVYISTTAGALTQTPPSGANDQVVVVGYARTPDIIYFKPDWSVIGVTE